MGPDDRGLFQLVITVGLLTATVGGFSAEIAMAERFGKLSDRRTEILATGVWGGPLWGLVVGLATLPVVAAVLDSDRGAVVHVCVAAQILVSMWQVWQQRSLLLAGHPTSAAFVLFVDAVGRLVLVGALIVLGQAGLESVLVAALCASTLALAVGGFAAGVNMESFGIHELFVTLRRGLKYHVGQLALAALMRLDVVLLAALGGLAATGIYAVSVSLTAPLMVLATSVATTFLHRQYTGSREEHVSTAMRLVTLSYVLLVPCLLIACLIVPPVVPIVWGQDYSGAVIPTLALLPGVLALSIQRPLSNALVREGLYRALNVRSTCAAGINVALGIVLIPGLGAVGAALASSVAYLVYAAMSFQAFATVVGRPTGQLVRDCLGWRAAVGVLSQIRRSKVRPT